MYPLVSPQARGCRTQSCPHCGSDNFKRNGSFKSFKRNGDSRRIQRFLCRACQRSFSRAGYSLWYRHRHRRHNSLLKKLLVHSSTLRGLSEIFEIDKDTVARHMKILADIAREDMQRAIAGCPQATHIQLDDLITFEHTKLKQLAVSLITDADRYRMLGFRVSRIPTSGLNAEKARKKYGPRPDESIENRHALLQEVLHLIDPKARFVTDKHKDYPSLIKKHCAGATHERHESRRACVAGQGEMKEGGNDPLFCINHQLAMLRARISRLVRRTWTTTKKIECLEAHLALMMEYYNRKKRPASAREYEALHDIVEKVA